MKKVKIYSGVPNNTYGAGKLLSQLARILGDFGHEVVVDAPRPLNTWQRFLLNTFPKEILRFLYSKLKLFKTSKKSMDVDCVILFHPQMLGIEKASKILNDYDNVFVYILDNFLFCIKSYNVHEGERCTKCIISNKPLFANKCNAFPVYVNKEKYLDFKRLIVERKPNLLFQTKESLEQHRRLYPNSRSTVVGMSTGEFDNEIVEIQNEDNLLVYHGGLGAAKGILVLKQWIKYLRDYIVVVPYSSHEVSKYISLEDNPNLLAIPMTWETGLKEKVACAKAVICPSIWDMPIEGALLKNLYFNGNVIVADVNYGYVSSLPDEIIIRWPLDRLSSENLNLLGDKEDNERRAIAAREFVENSNREFAEKIGNIFNN